MKEYTLITTVQITDIIHMDDYEPISKEKVEELLGHYFDCDDIKVTDRQMFIRDLPNEPEVVVGTPDLAVQGG